MAFNQNHFGAADVAFCINWSRLTAVDGQERREQRGLFRALILRMEMKINLIGAEGESLPRKSERTSPTSDIPDSLGALPTAHTGPSPCC